MARENSQSLSSLLAGFSFLLQVAPSRHLCALCCDWNQLNIIFRSQRRSELAVEASNYHGARHCHRQQQLGHRLEVQDDRLCCRRMAREDFHGQAMQEEGDAIQAWSQADGLCSRLQDMQRKGCSRVPRVQGDRQEQEERQHFREMEVFRVPRIWAQELPQLRQRRPHTRAEGGEMSEMLKMRAFRISDSALHIQTVNALPYSHLL